jgi:protein transport protein SEC31
LYDYEKFSDQNQANAPLFNKLSKHTGVVAALDTNPFQSNLLASGAGSSEIFIWDLNNPSVPMTPGAKTPVNTSKRSN